MWTRAYNCHKDKGVQMLLEWYGRERYGFKPMVYATRCVYGDMDVNVNEILE